jgi:hypothetical protein
MRCPKCDSENSDSAKFCKKCGNPLSKSEMTHESVINSISEKNSGDGDKTKMIIVALIIVAVVLAGALVYIYGFGNAQSSDSQVQSDDNQQSVQNDDDDADEDSEPAEATKTSDSAPSSKKTNMKILGGSFSTGSELEDKTYASIYVGPEFAGQSVIIQIFYSRDGSTLNNGNMVPKTVDSSGYIEVSSADAYKYYPDYAEINLYDSSSNLMDTQSVSLSPESGTQSF